MNLQDFIKNTLISIQDGLHSANLEIAQKKGKTLGKDISAAFCLEPNERDKKEGYIIFDVAVSVSSESQNSGGGKVNVVIAKLGSKVGGSSKEEQVSRIKFHVMPKTCIL